MKNVLNQNQLEFPSKLHPSCHLQHYKLRKVKRLQAQIVPLHQYILFQQNKKAIVDAEVWWAHKIVASHLTLLI